MSVINRMLRDLERRQGSEEHAIYTQQLRPMDPRGRKPLLLIGAAFLVAAGGTYAALQYFNRAAPIAPQIASAAPAIATVPPVAAPVPTAKSPMEAEPNATLADEAAADRGSSESVAPSSTTTVAHNPPSAEPGPPPVRDADERAKPDNTFAAVQAPMRATDAVPAVPTTPIPVPTTRIVAGDRPVDAIAAAKTKIDVRPHVQAARTADSEFRRAAALITHARSTEAREALKAALGIDARHEGARQTLAVLLIEAHAMNEAETLLTEGLKLNPKQSNFAIVLARLKLDRGDDAGALQTLREHGSAAAGNAEYRGFVAALLQRMNRPVEAIDEYRAALTLTPNMGVWWVGLGMAYEAAGHAREALEAYTRAHASGNLSADVAQFVESKLQTVR